MNAAKAIRIAWLVSSAVAVMPACEATTSVTSTLNRANARLWVGAPKR